jgi:predicted NAD/FAD-binding protein
VKIAVVGSGVSGLVSAHLLSRRHDVVLFEADGRVGGHTHTFDVAEDGRNVPVDTGFIVFNERTYPNLVKLLRQLGVAWKESDMSFSVRSDLRDFEYGSPALGALFAQRRNLVDPRFLRMLYDVSRFYRESKELLDEGSELPLVEWLEASCRWSDRCGRRRGTGCATSRPGSWPASSTITASWRCRAPSPG